MAGSEKSHFALVSVTWNRHGWEKVDTESKTGHDYVKDNPGHESFNFNFDIPNTDDHTFVYGHTPGMIRNRPRFKQPGLVFFCSHNYGDGANYIVGVYGNARRYEKDWPEVEMSEPEGLYTTIVAEWEYSARFPVYLDADKYKRRNGWSRLVPQSNIRYIDADTARLIMDDAIRAAGADDDGRLRRIRSLFYDGGTVNESGEDAGEGRQGLLDMMHWNPLPPGSAGYAVEKRRRDNRNVQILKELFCYRCQICGHSIRTRYGTRYVKAAHIRPKREGGSEVPRNILILCPNHHKEFDCGDVNITEHKADRVEFEMNGRPYAIELATPDGKT